MTTFRRYRQRPGLFRAFVVLVGSASMAFGRRGGAGPL